MRTLYFDCFAGASGNMILGALFDLGIDREEFSKRLADLGVESFKLRDEKADRSGISAVHVDVIVPEVESHRHLHHIEKIISDSRLSEGVKERSISIFRSLAEAEARVHGIDIGKVHFHEVGALDAIIDIVGACIGFEMLDVEQFACSKIHVGSGFVEMAHGKFPVPPPAVAELLKNVPIYSTEIEGELITPTGAAIISTLCGSYGQISEMKVEATGYGAGTREYKDFPNVIRLMVGEAEVGRSRVGSPASGGVEKLILLETNLDDTDAQVIGYVIERALEIGANDCWATPIQMKKSRPGIQLSVLCEGSNERTLMEMLYSETSTIGIRKTFVDRDKLDRKIVVSNTPYGEVRVKIAYRNGEQINAMPEYEDVRRRAADNGVSFRKVREAALAGLVEGANAATS
jgi:pyridinium-3,5-bisthiocarboxylic acid mononucleotide nickel chelatase